MHPVAEELTLLASSGYPLVYMLTWEEDRARRIIAEAVDAVDGKLEVWSLTKGRDPFELLDSLSDAAPGVTVLLDFHVHLAEPGIVRRLRDLVPQLSRIGHMLVLISPVLALPEELQKDVSLLQVPLPGREELDRLFRLVCVEEQVVFPEEFIDSLEVRVEAVNFQD